MTIFIKNVECHFFHTHTSSCFYKTPFFLDSSNWHFFFVVSVISHIDPHIICEGNKQYSVAQKSDISHWSISSHLTVNPQLQFFCTSHCFIQDCMCMCIPYVHYSNSPREVIVIVIYCTHNYVNYAVLFCN